MMNKNIAFAGLLALTTLSAQATTPSYSWNKRMLPGGHSFRGSAALNQSMWVSGSDNAVFRSVDNGQTWQNVSVKAELKTDFRDIELFDENTAIVMGAGTGAQSKLYKTSDGGRSWQLIFDNPDAKGFFDAIDFFDRQTGLLLGDPIDGYFTLYKTVDGGKTFRRIDKDKMPKANADEAAFAASGNTLITGPRGQAWFTSGGNGAWVYSSQDHGESWRKEAVPLYGKTATAGGYALALNSKNEVFVLGGDYQDRNGHYNHLSYKVKGAWQLPQSTVQRGLRTAMGCLGQFCISTGKLSTSFSFDGGKHWRMVAIEGYYTLAVATDRFVLASEQGKVAVIGFK